MTQRDEALLLMRTCAQRGVCPNPGEAARVLEWLSTEEAAPYLPLLPLFVHGCGGARALTKDVPGAFARLGEVHRRLLAVDVCQRRWLDEFVRSQLPSDTAVILLKGAAFYGTLYPPSAFRAAADIDLLAREEHFETIVSMLAGKGRRIVHHLKRPHSHKTYFEACFDMPGPVPIQVEVHRALTQPHLFTIDHAALFEHSLPHPAYGRENVRIMDPTDNLLHLAVHAVRHAGVAPHNAVDATLILSKWGVERKTLAYRSALWSAGTAVYGLLAGVERLDPGAVGQDLLRYMEPGIFRRALTEATLGAGEPAQGADAPSALRKAFALYLSDSKVGPWRVAADYLTRRVRDILEDEED